MLTPKFATGRSLICGPSLAEKSVQAKEGFFKKDSAEKLAVGDPLGPVLRLLPAGLRQLRVVVGDVEPL
jgi:hypothetical protein